VSWRTATSQSSSPWQDLTVWRTSQDLLSGMARTPASASWWTLLLLLETGGRSPRTWKRRLRWRRCMASLRPTSWMANSDGSPLRWTELGMESSTVSFVTQRVPLCSLQFMKLLGWLWLRPWLVDCQHLPHSMVVLLRSLSMDNLDTTLTPTMVTVLLRSLLTSLRRAKQTHLTGTKSPREDSSVFGRSMHNALNNTHIHDEKDYKSIYHVIALISHDMLSCFILFSSIHSFCHQNFHQKSITNMHLFWLLLSFLFFSLCSTGTHGRFTLTGSWHSLVSMASGSMSPTLNAVRANVTWRCSMLLSTANWYISSLITLLMQWFHLWTKFDAIEP